MSSSSVSAQTLNRISILSGQTELTELLKPESFISRAVEQVDAFLKEWVEDRYRNSGRNFQKSR
ncbi:hypothetical protein B0H12DRAFT_684137 [Mycena haematopus]|nr:hypothetical protein B0H12DRAFT_684137 [Mycena haematopus]